MSKIILEHQVDGDSVNSQLHLETLDEPDQSGACHEYRIEYTHTNPAGDGFNVQKVLAFQKGPIKEAGVNGLTNEVLLAVVLDRLRGFQTSKFKCVENEVAIRLIANGLATLKDRTKARLARGVEGTHEV